MKFSKLKLAILVVLMLGVFSLSAQPKYDLVPFRVATEKESLVSELAEEVTKHEVLEADFKIFKQISENAPDKITLIIPSEKRQIIELELKRVDIFIPEFNVTLASNNSIAIVKHGAHYRGKIRGDEQSIAAVSIFENEVIGLISSNDGNFVLGKLKGSGWTTEHII